MDDWILFFGGVIVGASAASVAMCMVVHRIAKWARENGL